MILAIFGEEYVIAIMQFSPVTCYFLPLKPKYSSQYTGYVKEGRTKCNSVDNFVYNGYGAHPASYPMGTGIYLPRGKADGE
jgi:hypothetical protein